VKIARHDLTLSANAGRGGTVISAVPLNGYVAEVRCSGTAFGATADFTLTRLTGQASGNAGTILALTAQASPFQVAPLQPVHTRAGVALAAATGGSALHGPIPVDGYVQLVIANATISSAEDTVSLYLTTD
jgi:hypothetical protein